MHPQNDTHWIEAVLGHTDGIPVPYNFMFSPVTQREAESRYGAPLEETLSLPLRMAGPKSIKPLYADPDVFGSTARDEYGVVWSTTRIDRGSPIVPVLKEDSLSGYRFPDYAQPHRFAELDAWCENNAGHFRIIWVGDLWERATFMRGMQELLLDTALNPWFVRELLDGIAAVIEGTMEILLGRYAFEAIAVSDDYGTQKAMVISPEQWRRFVKPLLARIYGRARERGKRVFHHSCGNIVPIIGDLIDIGLDILHPIQPEAMDIAYLKREFGSSLTFCGGVRTQDLLVRGTPAAVRDEVRRLKALMGKGGGYILEPGITLQADVPPENMIALIDEALANRAPDRSG